MVLDVFVAVFMVLGILRGMRRGFLLSLFSVGGLIAGVAAGWTFAPWVVDTLEREWGWLSSLEAHLVDRDAPAFASEIFGGQSSPDQLARILLTVVTFLVIYLVVRSMAEAIGAAARKGTAGGVLGLADKVLGSAFGLVATLLGLAVAFGVIIAVAPAVSPLTRLAELVEASLSARSLARLFFLMGPLSEMLGERVPDIGAIVSADTCPYFGRRPS